MYFDNKLILPLVACVSLLPLRLAADAAPASGIHWNAPEAFPVAPLTSQDYSLTQTENGNSATLLFNKLQVALNGNSSDLTKVQTASFRITLAIPAGKRLVGFRSDVRGFAKKTKGARVALLLDLGGKSDRLELGWGRNSPGDGAVTRRVTSSITGAQVYTATLVLIGERLSSTESVLVSVESIDIVPIIR